MITRKLPSHLDCLFPHLQTNTRKNFHLKMLREVDKIKYTYDLVVCKGLCRY